MFKGFSIETINFLKGLSDNNNKIWFEDNRKTYEEYLLKNFIALVEELSPYMLEIDPYFETNPKKCISRINRDIRFSKDKSPYRANMWLTFKEVYQDWKVEPAFFFELDKDSYRFGMGFYNVPKDIMDRIRKQIIDNDHEFNRVLSVYEKQGVFKLEGETYKRILNNEISDKLNQWYQRKEIYFVCNRSIDEILFSKELPLELIESFKIIAPIYEYFLKLRNK